MYSISHIINPVKVPPTSDLFIAQPITFASMIRAKVEAKGIIEVDLLSICYSEDEEIIPKGFIKSPNLTRSILDLEVFKRKRKLPLLKDILDACYNHSDADYLIYTNVDIALQPNFYKEIESKISAGLDAFVINRRTIPEHFTSSDQLDKMYAEKGELHKGYDCFVFKRSLYPRFKLGNVAIGVRWVGWALLSNLICYADNFFIFKEEHLTFHIGNDGVWLKTGTDKFENFNKQEFDIIISKIKKEKGSIVNLLRHQAALNYPKFYKLVTLLG